MKPCPGCGNPDWYYEPKCEECGIQRAATHHAKWEEAKSDGWGCTVPLHVPTKDDLYRAGYDRIFGKRK